MNWSKLKTRVTSAVILVALLLVVTFASEWVFTLAVSAICLLILREVTITFKLSAKPSLVIVNYIFATLYLIVGLSHYETGNPYSHMVTVFFVMALLILCVVKHDTVHFEDVCTSLFMVLYSVFFLIHLSFLRHQDNGLALVFVAFIGAWLPDTMAYFTGSFFGKHKLIEAISPNKTVEGSVGAIVGSAVSFAIYGGILTAIGYDVNFASLMVLSLILGVVAQFGDLAASVMKRACKAKDFGNLIPGHGGLLDRIDSLIFVTPVVYYYILFFPIL